MRGGEIKQNIPQQTTTSETPRWDGSKSREKGYGDLTLQDQRPVPRTVGIMTGGERRQGVALVRGLKGGKRRNV